ncbi:MAG: accessory gene regulator B family protein [Eubacteriales bacterium]
MNILISEKLADFLLLENDVEDRDSCIYGCQCLISLCSNIVVVIGIGILFHKLLESILFLVVIMLVRSYTGGFHAKTCLICNVILGMHCIGTLCISTYIINDFNICRILIWIMMSIFSVATFFLAPMEHPNKKLSVSAKKYNKRICLILILLFDLTVYILIFRYPYVATILSITLGGIGLALLVEMKMERRNEYV